ncbi:Heterokaryon incompatibility [Fusarium albosuccineum]|uniref:Heterokaryon incompatibility n=1 Tax=Fusarium albosuccineum TaxID=1237068 RepID=A0A8H4PFZ3_9HYPO|nr:Heterokaryon incompatibility [Fusarium albosuccineum]
MFSYKPISKANREIRLIRLAPSPGDESIKLELRHASADDNVPYHAVSYVWGDPKDIGPVTVDGEELLVSQNLIALFRQLLKLEVTAWLWTDSICINQADLEEKAWQVDAMDQVYGNAELVHLWLGPGTLHTDKAMKMIHNHGRQIIVDMGWADPRNNQKNQKKKNRKLTKQLKKALSTGKKPSSKAHQIVHFLYNLYNDPGLRHYNKDQPLDKYPLLDGLRDILERPFWRRVWIVQEITLAKGALLLCGDEGMPLEYYCETINMLKQITRVFNEFSDSPFLQDLAQILFAATTLDARQDRQEGWQLTLPHILQGRGSLTGPRYLATDPRDLVFGLLSIVREQNSLGLRADYSEPVGRVFARATKAFLGWRPPQDHEPYPEEYLWDYASPLDNLRPSNVPGMPSWTPDYESIGKNGVDISTIESNCSSRAGIMLCEEHYPRPQLQPNPDEDPMILCQRGCVVDTIVDVMSPFPDVSWAKGTRDIDTLTKAFAMLGRPVIEFMGLGPKYSREEKYIWKTMMLTFSNLWSKGLMSNIHFFIDPYENTWSFMGTLFRGQAVDLDLAENVIAEFSDEEIDYGNFAPSDSENETSNELQTYLSLHLDDYLASSDSGNETSSEPRTSVSLDDDDSDDDDSDDDDSNDERESYRDRMIIRTWNAAPDLTGRTLFKTAGGRLGMGRANLAKGDIVTLIWWTRSPIILRKQGDQYRYLGDSYVDGIMKGEILKTKPEEVVFELV